MSQTHDRIVICQLCGYEGPQTGLKRGGKKGQSKFYICPGCGEYKTQATEKELGYSDSDEVKTIGCLMWVARPKNENVKPPSVG
jgi:predicted RNA-binding Zn-ribbon protein involved in translation (DUF1610 family)